MARWRRGGVPSGLDRQHGGKEPELRSRGERATARIFLFVPADSLTERYFAGRTNGLRPSSSEALLVATT
jgi:hypothetical protein